MKRTIVGSILALAIAASGLLAQNPPKPKSQKEVEALQAMFNAQEPDARIKAAESVITKFADTEFKSIALFMMAASYQQKNDAVQTIVYCEQTLEADAKHFQAMIMLAETLAQRTREFDLDKDEKLNKADKFAKLAIETLVSAPKPNPQITEEQWTEAKKDLTAQAHQALGMTAMVRKKYDMAIAEFKASVDGSAQPDQATQVRLAAAYNAAGKYDNALPILEKLMAATDTHPSIRQFAQAERVRATQGKAGGAKPAAPAAPPQVEVKP